MGFVKIQNWELIRICDRTVEKKHGKKSTTILLVFCQQNCIGKKLTKNIIGN